MTSSATGGYVVDPEQLSIIEEQTRNAPSSYVILHQNLLYEIICILPVLQHQILSYLAHIFSSHLN